MVVLENGFSNIQIVSLNVIDIAFVCEDPIYVIDVYMQKLVKHNEPKCGRRTKNPLLYFILNPLRVLNDARRKYGYKQKEKKMLWIIYLFIMIQFLTRFILARLL